MLLLTKNKQTYLQGWCLALQQEAGWDVVGHLLAQSSDSVCSLKKMSPPAIICPSQKLGTERSVVTFTPPEIPRLPLIPGA